MHEEDVRQETREFSNITIKAHIDQISQDVANHGKTWWWIDEYQLKISF